MISEGGATFQSLGGQNTACEITQAVLSANGLYVSYLIPAGWSRNPVVNMEARSQYRPLLEIEENYHRDQFMGYVGVSQGGFGDIYTIPGMLYWIDAAGAGPFPYYHDTAEGAEALALADAQTATNLEDDYFAGALEARRCLLEFKAKEVADYQEAYTLECTYACPSITVEPPYDHHPGAS